MAGHGHQETDSTSILHAFRRFLRWRRSVPALTHGALHPVDLAEPLIGIVRTLDRERVPAVFNLSDRPVPFNRTTFGRLSIMVDCGFGDPGTCLPAFGAMFAEMELIAAEA